MASSNVNRRLAAILVADVVGYSRLMGEDESGTLNRVNTLREEIVQPKITENNGRVVKLMGDGLLAEFSSAVDAVQCAIGIQRAITTDVGDLNSEPPILLRIGVNLGDVIVEGSDIFGDGVNVAARLESIAEPGGISISSKVYDEVRNKLTINFDDLGEKDLKNIGAAVRVYRWSDGATISGTADPDKALSPSNALSIAVLPFTNMSGDAEQEYFSDGITEDIITELNRFRDLRVMARNSTFCYKGQSVKVQDVARELGVRHIIEGSVRKAGNRVRVTVQMLEGESGVHIWAERYDRELEDIFAIQDEITQSIVSILPGRILSAMREKSQRKSTKSFSAYDYYLQGRWIYENSSGDDPFAITQFEKAISIDPMFALPHAALGQLYAYNIFSLGVWYGDQESKAKPHIEKALEFGGNDPAVHALVGEAYFSFGDFDNAMTHLNLAIRLNPNDVYILEIYYFFIAHTGDAKEGLLGLEKIQQMDPQAGGFLWETIAEVQYLLCNYEASLEIYKGKRNPPPHTYTHMAACYAQLGRMEEAQQAVIQFKSLCAQDVNFTRYADNHVRVCKRQEDGDNWTNGYRKAGLID